MANTQPGATCTHPVRATMFALAACAALLYFVSPVAHARDVYRCTDAHGQLAFQDTPCATPSRQHKLDLHPLPRIGAVGEHSTAANENVRPRRAARRQRGSARSRHPRPRKVTTSWECRAADGEVFYRHTRCPSSVRGDGTVRIDYAERTAREHPRGRHDAWSRVRVHGVKVSRAEACRRIRSAGASGRDGHLRDEVVSTYDHLMGRDPCNGT